MSDARTKLDLIYLDVLGDVHALLEKVELLKSGIPATADQAVMRLEKQVTALSITAQKLQDTSVRELGTLAKAIDEHTVRSLDRSIAEAKQRVDEAVRATVTKALSDASIYKAVADAVAEIQQSSAVLKEEVLKLKAREIRIQERAAQGVNIGLIAAIASLMGALAGVLITKLF